MGKPNNSTENQNFQKYYDENRDAILSDLRLKVVRFKNEDLQNLPFLLSQIQQYL